MTNKRKIFIFSVLGILVLILAILAIGSRFFTDILWFGELGYLNAYFTRIIAQIGMRVAVGLIVFLFFYINLRYTKNDLMYLINMSNNDRVQSIFPDREIPILNWLNLQRLKYLFLGISIFIGVIFSNIGAANWETILKFINQSPTGQVDPIFGRDVSFYLFSLPVFELFREIAVIIIIFTIFVVGLIYLLSSGINSIDINNLKFNLSKSAKNHLIILLILYLITKAIDYRLQMYELMYSDRGVAFGASYTDINATLPGLRILMVLVILLTGLAIFSLFKKKYKLIAGVVGVWIIASVLLLNVYPGFVQRFQVEPNELGRETPYIEYNINMTQQAYNLDEVETTRFDLDNELTREDVDNNPEIFNNVRLWDPRPIQTTFSQLQELRQYYSFMDVDIDRYIIDDEYKQVLLSVREMNQSGLNPQAQTWVNQRLKYTHGMGVAMADVSASTAQGLPEMFIEDIPPRTDTDLVLDNPSVYYGESTAEYVIVNNLEEEFHYPDGGTNVYTNYSGNGGVQLDGYLKRALFSMRFNDIRIMLADDISPDSRMMFDRNIQERVNKIAPFLELDDDPYPVVADGKIYWIQDAYTFSNRYPYSEPINQNINYIRNSVKVVVDAYEGDVDFYIAEEDDPIVNTYSNIFPGLFKSLDEMPESLRPHVRYPADLFSIQAEVFKRYHMENPTVFYNQEDVWDIPNENYAGSTIPVEPYYISTRLPGEENVEFTLMIPFTPANRNNMVAWMAARSDGENYGEIKLFNFPRGELVYGPSQIESRIDQNAYISQLLSLWDQQGSRVIRGNLLVLPVENSIVYIEPIFLQAEAGALPELRRVIVGYNDMIAMEETLLDALDVVFGEAEPTQELDEEELEDEGLADVGIDVDADPVEEIEPSPEELEEMEEMEDTVDPTEDPEPDPVEIDDIEDPELINEIINVYNQAQQAIQQGDWQSYGQQMDRLEELLRELEVSQ
ncbi:UPF0182 family protein [Halanaerobiaceae bacterium Z-7014]|uniref:UPF0182 protein I0Q91_06685 n=1 Tax=Halonatronomonas betaini TaxID=2778430 RepID=A0A931F9R1_9FIRM|nr:UPF0182 family protein [Halonatronomonas betaini]MBF8436754.1 UPF0182 family protein [Halonatronomonas betaini]